MPGSLTASDPHSSGGTTNARVREVDPDNEADVAIAAHLHAVLFEQIGPIAKLGERLLRRYCYSYVLRTGLMKAVIVEVNGEPAGLAAFTGDPKKLHGAALRSHFPFLAGELIRAIIDQPSMLFRLPGVARLFWERRRDKIPVPVGTFAEVVAFGVLPQYVTRRFIRQTGVQVAEVLIDHVLDDVWAQGFTRLRGVILASNKPALSFFTIRASRVDAFPSALRPSFQIWLDMEAQGHKRSPHLKGARRPSRSPQ
jgi:hypothetical protein